MPEALLPPESVTLLELLRDWPQALEVGLYTNNVQMSEPVTLEDLTEASFPGYQRWNGYHLEVLYQQMAPAELIVAAEARFVLEEDRAPLTVRGWFLLAHLETGQRPLIAAEPLAAPVTIRSRGDVVLALLWLTVQRVAGDTDEDFLGTNAQVLALANGGRRVKFRGNDRKVLRNLKKAIEAVKRRDERWPARTAHSRMADTLILTEDVPDYLTGANTLLTRCTTLLALD